MIRQIEKNRYKMKVAHMYAVRVLCVCLKESEKEGYKERQSVCMGESGHCSRKSDLNPGHPENIYATVV